MLLVVVAALGVGALAAPLVGVLGTGAVSMAIVVAGGMVAAMVVLLVVVRPARLADLEPGAVVVRRTEDGHAS